MDEANAIVESVFETEKQSWEQVRWLGFVQAIVQGAKIQNPQDLMEFSWEKNDDKIIEIKSIEELKESFNWVLNP